MIIQKYCVVTTAAVLPRSRQTASFPGYLNKKPPHLFEQSLNMMQETSATPMFSALRVQDVL